MIKIVYLVLFIAYVSAQNGKKYKFSVLNMIVQFSKLLYFT